MSREIIQISVTSADSPDISAQTQFTADQFDLAVIPTHEIKKLLARVREQVGATTPVAVAFEKGGKKFVRRA